MQLRAMKAKDIDAVLAIESAVEFPWSHTHFKDSFTSSHDCTVMTDNHRVCGFSIFSRIIDEANLLNISIAPVLQGKGWGRFLLVKGLRQQFDMGARKCFLEVRASNKKAQALYTAVGFKQVGQRKNYYPAHTGREHALVMEVDLSADCHALSL
jgi:ribosomal-protein-alanine N-acetyltransferase